jgi:hypothetical protein
MKKIKEVAEFAKMFKLNIPIEKHFEYYIQTLFKSYEFKDIISLVDNYSEFEEWLQKNGYNNVGHYKMGTVYSLLKNHLETSEAYKKCQEFDYSQEKLYTKDHLKMYEGNFMLSLDFSSANFQSMKIFDYEDQLKSNWVELCDLHKIHPIISSSKSFRQVVFGNLNPKRFQKIQHYHMLKLVEELEEIFPSENIIFISHDELVMNLGDNEEIAYERIEQVTEIVKTLKEKRLNNNKTWMNVSPTIFKMKKISKDVYLKTIFFQTIDGLVNGYKTLFGCPGNKYYINFKKYVLEENIEEKDCLFMLDNSVAKWVL